MEHGEHVKAPGPSCESPPAFPGAVKQVAPFGHDLKTSADLCRGWDPCGRAETMEAGSN